MIEWLQNLWSFIQAIDIHQVEGWLQKYSSLGPLPGILLPLLESFFPFLPLIVFVMGNAAAYGLWLGFFLSWIGVCLGAVSVFWLARMFGGRLGDFIQKKLPGGQKFLHWIEEKGFTPLFLIFCLPFIPSSLIVIASGASKVNFGTFVISLIAGKSVMVFMMAFIGHDWQGFIQQPWRILVALFAFGLLWLAGKKLENRFQH
ncbi:TVP38/TMEM64 family protein [Brevibacillus daliensis]|uniref:TVP38/TMEM64 family protein n=1 Tax=Brevibacillus daliensis TaxID=2892995 RepID=UPI001E51B4C1|nr:VTT domain-containing protein [Brevibacillus daliensis]